MWNYGGTQMYEDFGDYGASWTNPDWMNSGTQNWTDITMPGEGTFNTGPALVGGYQPMGTKSTQEDRDNAYYAAVAQSAPVARTAPVADTPVAQPAATSPQVTNTHIQDYLRSLGVDPSLFGTYGANQLNALERYDAGTGDYSSWDYRSIPFEQMMKGLSADPTNNNYTFGVDRFSTKGDNYGVQLDPSTGGFGLRAKVGDKDSVEVPYKLQPDGTWAPDWMAAKAATWDTNAGTKRDIRGMATVLGAAAGSYFLGPAGAGAEVGTGSGAGAAGWGIMDPSLMAPGAFEAAMGGSAAIPGMTGGQWGMMDPTLTAPGAFEAAMGAAPAAAAGGSQLPLEAAQYLPEAEAAIAGAGANAPLYGGTNGSAAFSGLSSIGQISELVKQGMSVSEAIKQIMGAGGSRGSGGAGGVAGGNNGILDLIAGLYSAKQMKDYSGNLKDMYSSQLGRQQPFYNQLLASYQDPDTFYNSNQYKGLASVYQNSIDRQAAQKGRLANPTDREVLLQAHAMKELENFRTGLRGNVTATDPAKYADAYAKGLQAEAYANSAPWAAIGNMANRPGGVTGSVATTVGQIDDILKAGGDIWDVISGWFDT